MRWCAVKLAAIGSVALILGASRPVFEIGTVQGASQVVSQGPSADETQVWQQVAGASDHRRRAQAAEAYLESYPEGSYAPYAHEIIAVTAHRDSNMDLFIRHAELAVAGLPDEVSLMSSLSVAYAERQEPDPAIRHGEAALAILPTMDRPQAYSAESWPNRRDQFMADAHYGTGTGYLFKAFQQGSGSPLMPKALDHLIKATELLPRDERNHFRLGFAWQINGELDKAVLEYARAAALEGANLALARRYLEQAYQSLHGNRRDLDKLVTEQKRYLRELAGEPN